MWVEAVLAIGIVGGFFVLRGVFATLFFYHILPEGDRCPICDAHTLRVESRGMNRFVPWIRTSWCIECGWDGWLRHEPHVLVSSRSLPRATSAATRQR